MTSVTDSNFGPLVAYLVPGATALAGLAPYSSLLRSWFASTPAESPSIGGFLYLTLAALAIGMTVSAVRWAFIDTFHGWTGLKAPKLDFVSLPGKLEAFAFLVNVHYRHYQFYANMIVATAIAYAGYRGFEPRQISPVDGLFVALETIFFLTSRDTLRKYYKRSEQLFSKVTEEPANEPLIWKP